MKRSNVGIGLKPGAHIGAVLVVSRVLASLRKCLICTVSLGVGSGGWIPTVGPRSFDFILF